METIYQYQLEVYKTTCESDHIGGFQTITKDFDTLYDATQFKQTADYQKWIDDNNFPHICEIGNDRILEIRNV